MLVYALICDYGYDGERFAGVYSTEEKAKAATFERYVGGTWEIIPINIDEYRDWVRTA